MMSETRTAWRAIRSAVLGMALAVAACASKPPPETPVAVATVALPEKPVSPPRPPPPPKPVDLRWTFSTGGDMCSAVASGPGGSFQVQTGANRQILVTARFSQVPPGTQPRPRPAKLSFTGPAGEWTIPGTWLRREFTGTHPLDERGVASVLGVLSGGTVLVTAGTLHLGTARFPSAGGDGSAWVQCPKRMMAAP